MGWELSIKLGTYTFILSSESIDLSDEVPGQLHDFKLDGEADFRVIFRSANHAKEENELSEAGFSVEHSSADRDIIVDIKGENVTLDMQVLSATLLLAYSYAVATSNTEAAILHAAGASYHDRGFLFVGPSGAGKSTISELLQNAKIAGKPIETINDETVIVESNSHGFWIHPTPFRPSGQYNSNLIVPLSAIFVLEKAHTPRVERIPLAESITHILKQIFIRDYTSSQFMEITPSHGFDFACELASKIPLYRLCFAKDLSFLPVLDDVCNKTPVILEGVVS